MNQRLRTLGLVTAVLMLLGAGIATAIHPHFTRASAAGPSATGDLAVSFKLAGLGDNQTLTITASVQASAVYACRNHGGNFPSDPKKTESTGVVTASGEFTSGKNGQITGGLTVRPPAATLSCPPGQKVVLVSVTYSGVRIDAGVASISVSGTFSRVFYDI